MDNIAYQRYIEHLKKVDTLKSTFVELYGELTPYLLFKARRDGVITDQEWTILRREV